MILKNQLVQDEYILLNLLKVNSLIQTARTTEYAMFLFHEPALCSNKLLTRFPSEIYPTKKIIPDPVVSGMPTVSEGADKLFDGSTT